MILKIALLLSVLLQFAAAFIAMGLIKKTKFNIAWILISVGFFLMAFRRLFEFAVIENFGAFPAETLISSWIAVVISVLIFSGTLYIRHLFGFLDRISTIRKQNEAKILAAIINTEEKERLKFAKELHDGLAPVLASVKMNLSALNRVQIGDFNLKVVENTDFAIDLAIASVKEISNNISPHILENFGLEKALKSYTNALFPDSKFAIVFNSNLAQTRFHPTVEIILFRVLCELFTNTIKHAGADKLDLNLFYDKKTLSVLYSDNGKGFDLQYVSEESVGMGLANIKSRIKSVNGEFSLYSKPGHGFYFSLKINLEPWI